MVDAIAHAPQALDTTTIIALVIFALTFLGIIFEVFDKAVVALSGAVLMILFNVIDAEAAIHAVDFEVIVLLMSMMILVEAATESKIFTWLNVRITRLTRGNPFSILTMFVLVTMFMSAFLDNVTTVLIIVPITIALVRGLGKDPTLYVLTEIIFSNIGGALTLIGDPPNILIGARAGFTFIDFIKNLYIPIIASTFVIGASILAIYWKQIKPVKDNLKSVFATRLLMRQIEYQFVGVTMSPRFVTFTTIGLCLTIMGFLLQTQLDMHIHVIALAGAALTLLTTSRHFHAHQAFHAVEWTTLFFFAGLFVVVGGVEHSGLLNYVSQSIAEFSNTPIVILLVILWTAGILSMVLDNIPFVTVMLPVVAQLQVTFAGAGFDTNLLWWALSLGACLGGNGTLVGASANVCAAGVAKKHGLDISFGQFFKFGFPIAIVSLIISSLYLIIKV